MADSQELKETLRKMLSELDGNNPLNDIKRQMEFQFVGEIEKIAKHIFLKNFLA